MRHRAAAGASKRLCGQAPDVPLPALLSDDGDRIPSGYWFDGMFGDVRET